jgi:hypothetical protein
MPYIPQDDRDAFDHLVNKLVAAIKVRTEINGDPMAWAGFFNYCTTSMMLQLIPARKYWATALTKGIYSDLADEFTRRYQNPYEDEAIEKNGDCY